MIGSSITQRFRLFPVFLAMAVTPRTSLVSSSPVALIGSLEEFQQQEDTAYEFGLRRGEFLHDVVSQNTAFMNGFFGSDDEDSLGTSESSDMMMAVHSDEDLAYFEDGLRALMEVASMDASSMSMSMSFFIPTVDVSMLSPAPASKGSSDDGPADWWPVEASSPTTGSTTTSPAPSPSVRLDGSNDDATTATPSGSSPPTTTTVPVSTLSIMDNAVLTCSPNGTVEAVMPSTSIITTTIGLTFAYAAEVMQGDEIASGVLDELEILFLESVVAAILGCANGRRFRSRRGRSLGSIQEGSLREVRRLSSSSNVDTDSLGLCVGSMSPNSYCEIYETEMSFQVQEKNMDMDMTEYVAYTTLEDGMKEDAYVENVDNLDKLTFLLPDPIMPPQSTEVVVDKPLVDLPTFDGTDGDSASGRSSGGGAGTNKFRALSIGLGVAVAVGGVAAIVLFRRRHSHTQKEFEKEASLTQENGSFPVNPPSPPSSSALSYAESA